MRSLVGDAQERLARELRSLGALSLHVCEEPGGCPICAKPMVVRKTAPRRGVTLEHGTFEAVETIHQCPAGCRWPSGAAVIRRATAMTERLVPGCNVGYDVMVFVGVQRFVHNRQREEIRSALEQAHGVVLSTGEISRLVTVFVSYLEALHRHRASALRAVLESDGGWPLHIDATGEDGRGTLLAVIAGWRGWVLGGWKIPTEHAEAIVPHLRTVLDLFGEPCAFMSDMGKAMGSAIAQVVEERELNVPVLICHLHFLRDVGKDLLEGDYAKLRAAFRHHKVRSRLRGLARDLGRKLGSDIDQARADVAFWQDAAQKGHTIPDGTSGIAVVRALAQWVLDYAADGGDQGFPFERPYVDLFERAALTCRAADAFLRCPPEDRAARTALERLHAALEPVVCEVPFGQLVVALDYRAALFEELRTALRLTPKPTGRNDPAPHAPEASRAALVEIRDIEKALTELVASLQKRRPGRGPAKDKRAAIDLVLRHIDAYGGQLWGHAIALPGEPTGRMRLVARTNNNSEGFFHQVKSAERRRSGRKNLAQDLENLPAAAVLAQNLRRADYVTVLCGDLEHLASAFADLDAARRVERNQTPAEAGPIAPRAAETATASLPRADRPLIRSDAMMRRVLDAAGSRAPHLLSTRRRPGVAVGATGS